MRITIMCLRNLVRRRLRTSLCILGITLAVMFIVAIGATTTTYISAIKEMNLFFSGDVVVVARGVFVIYVFPIGGALQENVVDEVKQIEGVRTAIPMLFVISSEPRGVIQFVPENVSIGIPTGEWSVLVGLTPLKPGGSWPSADSGRKEVVVGPSLADEHNLTVNSRVKIKNYDLKVAGILETQSPLLSRSIIMPLKLAQKVYRYNMLVNMIIVKPLENVMEKELASRIEAELGSVKALTSDDRDKIVEPVLRDVDLWNLGLRSMLLFLSMILVITVSMMNISERRRDFATLDAIGAPRSTIFRIVITETSLIGLIGGLVGIVLGTVTALFIASVYTSIPISFFFQSPFGIVSPLFIIKILAFTVAISCIAGVIPAIAVTRMNITEVLRSEY